jgi:murein L,D-transpeptidase YcbB/YkuD
MNKLHLFILCCILLSCKKEPLKSEINIKDTVPTLHIKAIDSTIKIDSLLLIPFNSKTLQAFYKSMDYKSVWQSEENRKTVLNQLVKSNEEGLDPTDYDIKTLQDYEKKFSNLADLDAAIYDISLTYNFEKYISHLTNGKLNPRNLYDDWDLPTNKIDINKTLTELLQSDSLTKKIDLLKPQHIVYKSLKRALRLIDDYPKDDFKTIEISKKITANDTNRSVIDVKKRLIYWKDLQATDSLNSLYDQATIAAVKKFQTRHGLAADAVIGQGTLAALNFSKRQRKNQIIANLERWKWYPKEMANEYIIINIPDYKLTLVKSQDSLKTHKVIVGRIKRKTPVLTSKLTQAVFNPTWTVPPTILKEDVIPAILRSRSYLAKTNIRLYDSNGNEVSPANWRLSRAYNYRYVQSPGTFNSLGMVKLNFPNRFSVYLHDTNHRDFFNKTNRSLSSGCVRVDNPLDLTEYLLDDPINWNLEKITETLQNEKTKFVPIKKEVAFYLLYWTSWSENNKLIFRDDIYNLDADLYHKLRN